MSEHEKTSLGEEELEDVAGGEDLPLHGKCWFTPAAGWRKDPNGSVWKKCNSTCTPLFTPKCCVCYSTHHCVEKWHRVYEIDDSLYPSWRCNHTIKKPPSYEDNT